MGYIDIKQQETYKKLKFKGWYSKWYWYFINVTTSDNNNDDNTPASTVTATTTTNTSNNYNNNVIIIKIIITIKLKSGCALKKLKCSYIYCLPHFLFVEKNVS